MTEFFQSCPEKKLDKDAVQYVRDGIKPILEYFEKENEHIFRGMSLFIVTESCQKKYSVKLIDFVSIERIADNAVEERDQGIVKGLKSIDEILEKIQKESTNLL